MVNTAQIEDGTFQLAIETVQLDEVIGRVVVRWRARATHRCFETYIPREVPPVAADARRIEQVLDNLLGNVVKYTPADTQAAVRLDVMHEVLQVSVRDEGPGVRPEDVPYLFDRFFQAASQTSEPRRGNGLGLFISKVIVEQHGGRIWVESQVGIGSTFHFTLPRRRVAVHRVAIDT
jgi:signal transduction histidine kinase